MSRQVAVVIFVVTMCLLLSPLLFACTPVTLQPITMNCVATVPYTAEFQQATADELGGMANHYPHVSQMIVDYGAERAALRACK